MALYKIIPDSESLYKHLELYVNDEPLVARCMMVEDSQYCHYALHEQGFCSRHYHMMKQFGLLHQYSHISENCIYEIYGKEEEDLCRIIEKGDKCDHKSDFGGLCHFHYEAFIKQDCLEEFVLPEGTYHRTYIIACNFTNVENRFLEFLLVIAPKQPNQSQ